jgi:hypothetical protein
LFPCLSGIARAAGGSVEEINFSYAFITIEEGGQQSKAGRQFAGIDV